MLSYEAAILQAAMLSYIHIYCAQSIQPVASNSEGGITERVTVNTELTISSAVLRHTITILFLILPANP